MNRKHTCFGLDKKHNQVYTCEVDSQPPKKLAKSILDMNDLIQYVVVVELVPNMRQLETGIMVNYYMNYIGMYKKEENEI
jgi:hypothetical protein